MEQIQIKKGIVISTVNLNINQTVLTEKKRIVNISEQRYGLFVFNIDNIECVVSCKDVEVIN